MIRELAAASGSGGPARPDRPDRPTAARAASATCCASGSAAATAPRSTTRRRSRRPRRPGRRSTGPSPRTAGSPSPPSRWTTPRPCAAPTVARSTTWSWRCARAPCGATCSSTTPCPTEPLIAMVPVSIRGGDEGDTYQNRVSALLASLATDEADPGRAPPARPAVDDRGEGQLRRHPGRDAAGLRPVRAAGGRRPGHADVQPAAHRRPHEPAVQPHHLQRARPGLPAVLGRRPS